MKHLICIDKQVHVDNPFDSTKTLCGKDSYWYKQGVFKTYAKITTEAITCS